ncbi:MAG: aldehyde dehydrogenase family protein, partial [Enterococcus italicus]
MKVKTYDKFFYDGKWQTAHAQKYAEVFNPTTEEVIAKVIQADHADIDQAVASAKKAFPAWNALKPSERAEYVKKLLARLEARKQEVADTIIAELGASRTFVENGQVPMSIKEMSGFLEEFEQYAFEEEVDNALVLKEGYGVVACITPWNYPFNQIQRKLTPALLTGNTVVVK